MEPLANPHLPLQLSKNRQSGLGAPVGAQESHMKMAVIRGTLGFLMPCGRSPRLRQIIEAVPVHRCFPPCQQLRGLCDSPSLHLLRSEGGHTNLDRKSVVSGKSVSVRVDLGGGRLIKKKKNKHK